MKHLAFTPSPEAREYFDDLNQRLSKEMFYRGHATQRETFDLLVELARKGEAARDGFPAGLRHLLGKTRKPAGLGEVR